MPTFNSFQEMRRHFFPVQYAMEHLKRKKPMVAAFDEPWWFIKEMRKDEFIKLMDSFPAMSSDMARIGGERLKPLRDGQARLDLVQGTSLRGACKVKRLIAPHPAGLNSGASLKL